MAVKGKRHSKASRKECATLQQTPKTSERNFERAYDRLAFPMKSDVTCLSISAVQAFRIALIDDKAPIDVDV